MKNHDLLKLMDCSLIPDDKPQSFAPIIPEIFKCTQTGPNRVHKVSPGYAVQYNCRRSLLLPSSGKAEIRCMRYGSVTALVTCVYASSDSSERQ